MPQFRFSVDDIRLAPAQLDGIEPSQPQEGAAGRREAVVAGIAHKLGAKVDGARALGQNLLPRRVYRNLAIAIIDRRDSVCPAVEKIILTVGEKIVLPLIEKIVVAKQIVHRLLPCVGALIDIGRIEDCLAGVRAVARLLPGQRKPSLVDFTRAFRQRRRQLPKPLDRAIIVNRGVDIFTRRRLTGKKQQSVEHRIVGRQ